MLEILELHYCIIIRNCMFCRPLARTGQVLRNGWLRSRQEKKNQTIFVPKDAKWFTKYLYCFILLVVLDLVVRRLPFLCTTDLIN